MGLSDILDLFGWSLLALGATAVAAPAVGAFLHARGASFQGLLLPQLATLGIAVGFALYPWLAAAPEWISSAPMAAQDAPLAHPHGDGPGDAYILTWAALFTLLGAAVLSRFQHRGGSESARVAGAFAVAGGGTVLAYSLAPAGGLHVEALLHGEVLAVGPRDAVHVATACVLALTLCLWSWRDLLLAGQDPVFARAIGAPASRWNLLLSVATCAVVSIGTWTLGPLTLFALLVLPPLGVHARAPSMASFMRRSMLTGFLGAAVGATLSFEADLPMGASVVAGAAAVAALAFWAGKLAPGVLTRSGA